MKIWVVKWQHDKVIVTIMKNKSNGTYSFINLTKEHICPCKFTSIDDALKDEELTDEQKKDLKRALSEVEKMEKSISSINTSKTKSKKIATVKNEVNLNISKEKNQTQKQLEDDGREM